MDNSWLNLSCPAYESLDTSVVVEISHGDSHNFNGKLPVDLEEFLEHTPICKEKLKMSACKRLDLEIEFVHKTSRHCSTPGPLELLLLCILLPFEKMAIFIILFG